MGGLAKRVLSNLNIITICGGTKNYASLMDRSICFPIDTGIILILLLIGFNYAIGLVALWRAQLLLLVIFALVDLVLAILCLASTHQGHHIGNWGALVMFSLSFLLSTTVVWQTVSFLPGQWSSSWPLVFKCQIELHASLSRLVFHPLSP